LVGENGPEFFIPNTAGNIIPNDKISSVSGRNGNGSGGSGSGSSTVINLNVNAGMGTQGAEVGRQIVDALKSYERRNGAVYVSAWHKGQDCLWPAAGGAGNFFTLDDPTKGELNNATFKLAGDILEDVTNEVRSVTVRRGRSRELERFQAGAWQFSTQIRPRSRHGHYSLRSLNAPA